MEGFECETVSYLTLLYFRFKNISYHIILSSNQLLFNLDEYH